VTSDKRERRGGGVRGGGFDVSGSAFRQEEGVGWGGGWTSAALDIRGGEGGQRQ
jgi:hypothetical protein